jgi:hypothetical protein
MRRPKAVGECDRCSGWVNLINLIPQKQWAGYNLVDTGYLVCRDCLDRPQEQLRAFILPQDPRPLPKPRVSPNITPIAYRESANYAGPNLTDEFGNPVTDEFGNPISLGQTITGNSNTAVFSTSPENLGFTQLVLDGAPFPGQYPTDKAGALSSVAAQSGISTPAQVFDRSVASLAGRTSVNIMGTQPARGWLLLYNPVAMQAQVALSTTAAWGTKTNLILGPGEAYYWSANQLLAPVWTGAVSVIGLFAGMPFYAWESPGAVAIETDEFGVPITDEFGQWIPLV